MVGYCRRVVRVNGGRDTEKLGKAKLKQPRHKDYME